MKISRPTALAVLLAAAAALRFTGLGWGLRHPPAIDEYYFVSSTSEMLARGDFDHRFHEYPALLFYILAVIYRVLGQHEASPSAYLVARMVVAAFGVASVALTWRLARPLAGDRAALFAAAVVAVSPLEVRTAHMIRPDVVLEVFCLFALIAFRKRNDRAASDVAAGAALGAATAVKFSGVLLAPSYAVEWLVHPGRRRVGVAIAATAAVATFALLSPSTFLWPAEARAGMASQVAFHYAAEPHTWREVAVSYASAFADAVGAPAAALALAGLFLGVRAGRQWWSLAVLPLFTVLLFSTADVVRVRFLIPTLGVLAVFAGYTFDRLAARTRPPLAALLAAAALAIPLAESVRDVASLVRPGPRDRAADWLAANAPDGARVVMTAQAALGLPARLEVLRVDGLDGRAWLAAREADFVVSGGGDDRRVVRQLSRVQVMRPDRPAMGGSVVVSSVPDPVRRSYEPVPVSPGLLSASSSEGLERLCDGDRATVWRLPGARETSGWLQVELPAPVALGRVELLLEDGAKEAPNLSLAASEDGRRWAPIAAVSARPGVAEQAGPPSQVLVFDPVRARRLRVLATGSAARTWAVAEVNLDAVRPPLPP